MSEADLPIFYEQQRDPDACRMAGIACRERDAFMAQWQKILTDETVTKRTILDGGRVAGNIVGFEEHGEPQVGYWLGREFWGHDVATRALALFLGLVVVRPLYARVAQHNHASRRVLEKCGFVVRGEGATLPGAGGEAIPEFILKLDARQEDEAR